MHNDNPFYSFRVNDSDLHFVGWYYCIEIDIRDYPNYNDVFMRMKLSANVYSWRDHIISVLKKKNEIRLLQDLDTEEEGDTLKFFADNSYTIECALHHLNSLFSSKKSLEESFGY